METLLIVLASAGTAAFVAGLMTLVGQHFERRSKRRELLLEKAAQFATIRVEHLMKTADRNGQRAVIPDLPFLAERYYQALEYLLDNGKLQPEVRDGYEKAWEELQASDVHKPATSVDATVISAPGTPRE